MPCCLLPVEVRSACFWQLQHVSYLYGHPRAVSQGSTATPVWLKRCDKVRPSPHLTGYLKHPETISWWQQSCSFTTWNHNQRCLVAGLWLWKTSTWLLALSPWAMSFQVPELLFRCMDSRSVPAMQLLLSANSQDLRMPPKTGGLPPEV